MKLLSEAKSILKPYRNSMYVGLLILVVFWTLFSRVPLNSAPQDDAPPSPRQGFSAPDFKAELLDGGQVTLSELRGQAVVLNVWATWCPPCRQEMPALEKVYNDFKQQGLVLIGLNLTSQDSEKDVVDFVQEYGLSFPVALDRDGTIQRKYKISGYPTTFFIDRDGIIRSVVVGGPMSAALIQSKVEDLLREAP
jgi:cytochrome c biogenesis protein CcmG/thiol:disulfide interchange protein DsbE